MDKLMHFIGFITVHSLSEFCRCEPVNWRFILLVLLFFFLSFEYKKMSKLNKDVLFSLFKELQDDSKSLFSCLMVNKLWCETMIPVLWENPWRYNVSYYYKSSLYYIIIFYLSNDIKEFLTRQGIQLPSTSYQSLLFDYLSFCKSINMGVINNIIDVGSSDYGHFLLQQEVYALFMRKCPE